MSIDSCQCHLPGYPFPLTPLKSLKPLVHLPRQVPSVKYNIYQTRPDEVGLASWTKQMPNYAEGPAEDSESRQYALIVRNVKSYKGTKTLDIHSIVVQSEPLKKFLADIFKGYPGLTLALARVEFSAPFKPFIHRWKNLTDAKDTGGHDEVTKAHVDLLYNVLEEELRDVISQKNDLIANGVITHKLLYAIFEPDELIYSVVGGHQRAFAFQTGFQDSSGYAINGKFIDFDGKEFGFANYASSIPVFEGTASITSLPLFPLKYHSDHATIRNELIARGALWEQHKGYHYKQYEGIANGYYYKKKTKFTVKGRTVIDSEAYGTFNPDLAPSFASKAMPYSGCQDDLHIAAIQQQQQAIAGNRPYRRSRMAPDAPSSLPSPLPDTLTDEQRLIATPIVRGYSLDNKKWLEFYLDGVRDIVWNSQAFDSLVLPDSQQDLKQLILAFANAQSKKHKAFDDVVQGKGRGIIMLLRGPPGVGKTLTAESVAEVLKVPLYVLSAGDLGTRAPTLEKKLKDILSTVPKWGAVLLLDEADVFMETRSTSDLDRNELVSIFLRLLEYYEGLLFLTSNRAENLDPAFESRIHLTIQYPELNTAARRQIWSQFLRGTDVETFSSDQLDLLAEVALNGREIKNVVKTAYLLASEQDRKLGYDLVQTVLRLRGSSSC
ncbi:P-loop containing nucleoside triphosphate hydrolase protein [Aspergillus granulosus]|uniref:P-loop containing nucleoside triphosphate hydrolase protein n=1 Tax=Aspergillus granulosus TaxID=176169 RepID=A0ABR4HWR7_9EURO